jgi:hypothetical protein
MTWARERKTELTPTEVIMVAHAHLIGGVDQHTLASLYSVNQGRVNEAIVVMRETAENHKAVHRARAKA